MMILNGEEMNLLGEINGAWHNPHTKESLFPDFNHLEGIAPHWDWTDKFKRVWRIFRNYFDKIC